MPRSPDHQPDRRDIVLGLTATGAVGATPVTAATDPLGFLAVGDWGRRGQSHQRDVALAMEQAAKDIGSRFVLSLGDNFYPDGVASLLDTHWKASFEDVYDGPHLQTPWYVALGNHDYHGEPQAQLNYARTSARWRMPAHYYKVSGTSLGFSGLDLFCIDSTPLMAEFSENGVEHSGRALDRQIAADQLAWLERELASSSAPWKLVFGHHTIRSGGSGHGDTPEMVEKVLPILQRHKVQAYICGHDHDLQHIVNDGLHYIVTGAGSEVRPVTAVKGTRFCASTSGFVALQLTSDELVLVFRDLHGTNLYKASIHHT